MIEYAHKLAQEALKRNLEYRTWDAGEAFTLPYDLEDVFEKIKTLCQESLKKEEKHV